MNDAKCVKGTGTLTFQDSCKCQRTCPLDIKKNFTDRSRNVIITINRRGSNGTKQRI
jgi:hypothetical protein